MILEVIILNLNLTGIDAHNDALDDTLPEIDYTDLDVVFEGIPAKNIYNEGQDVTLTMKATTPSELFFDGDEVVAPFGKESTAVSKLEWKLPLFSKMKMVS